MIVLVYWYPSVNNLNKDSNWRLVWNMVNSVKNKNISWLINKPKQFGEIGNEYKKENVMFYETEHNLGRMNSVFMGRWEWVDRIKRELPVDIIWNNLVEVSDIFSFTFDTNLERIPVIGQHHYVMHKSLGSLMFNKQVMYRQILGAIMSDMNIFHSGHAFNMFRESVEESGLRVNIRATYVPLMVFTDKFRETLKNAKIKKEGIPKLIYNHRLESYKNYTSTFQKLDEIYREGYKFEMYVTYGKDRPAFIKRYEWAKTVDLPRWEDYIELLCNCDLGVLESNHETFCISAVEAMGCGVKMYMPNAITFEEIKNDRAVLFDRDWREDFKRDLREIDRIRNEKRDDKYLERFGEGVSRRFEDVLLSEYRNKVGLPEKKDLRDYLKKNIKETFFDKLYNEFIEDMGIGLQACPPFVFSRYLTALGYTVNILNGEFIISKLDGISNISDKK